MTDTATYKKSPPPQNTNEWMLTGVVLASPSTGQIKAVMPIFNSYSDIRIENIMPIDSDTLSAEEDVFASGNSKSDVADGIGTEAILGAKLSMQEGISASQTTKWRAIMRKGAMLDMQHLSVMVGLASLSGAVTNIIFGVVSGVPAPQSLIISVTVIGFLGGRFLSEKLRMKSHG